MALVELGGIDSNLDRNKLRLCDRALVITAIQSQRVRMSAPIPHIKIVMWHDGLQLREARQRTGPRLSYLSQLLLLLALGVGLITLLACALGVLLGTL
jgi:hypothetical protein